MAGLICPRSRPEGPGQPAAQAVNVEPGTPGWPGQARPCVGGVFLRLKLGNQAHPRLRGACFCSTHSRVLPEKCERFSGKEARQNKKLGSFCDSIKTGRTLEHFPTEVDTGSASSSFLPVLAVMSLFAAPAPLNALDQPPSADVALIVSVVRSAPAQAPKADH